MKNLGLMGLVAAMMLSLGSLQAPAQAKSFGSMINSAVNAYDGRSGYYNQHRYNGYGYNNYGYGNPYYARRHYVGNGYNRYRRGWY